jgi:hypothetical protein
MISLSFSLTWSQFSSRHDGMHRSSSLSAVAVSRLITQTAHPDIPSETGSSLRFSGDNIRFWSLKAVIRKSCLHYVLSSQMSLWRANTTKLFFFIFYYWGYYKSNKRFSCYIDFYITMSLSSGKIVSFLSIDKVVEKELKYSVESLVS